MLVAINFRNLICALFSGNNMKNCNKHAILTFVVVLVAFNSEVYGVLFNAPQNNCSNDRQCKYGICRKVNNPICSAGSNFHSIEICIKIFLIFIIN